MKIIYIKILIILIISIISMSGCGLVNVHVESLKEDAVIEVIESIDKVDEIELSKAEVESHKSFDSGIDYSFESGLRDPFKPFYLIIEDTEKEDLLILEEIYSEDGIFYAIVNINGIIYKLKEGDVFHQRFQLQSINVDSIVLLVGDEYLTVYMN